MGVFKKFIGGLACESMQVNGAINITGTYSDYTTISYKSTDGESHNNLSTVTSKAIISTNGLSPYANLSVIATTDELSDYSVNDYSIDNSVGTISVTQSNSFQTASASRFYNITLTAGDTDITVSCFKFYKTLYYGGQSAGANVLICGYYLDSPLSITAGESRTITIEMKITTQITDGADS